MVKEFAECAGNIIYLKEAEDSGRSRLEFRKLHLIEMKSSVGNEKWIEIKGKFRASYLLAQGIAAMLEMNIVDACMYTTFENVHLSLPETSRARSKQGESSYIL